VIRVEEVECVMDGAKRCKYVGEWKQTSPERNN